MNVLFFYGRCVYISTDGTVAHALYVCAFSIVFDQLGHVICIGSSGE